MYANTYAHIVYVNTIMLIHKYIQFALTFYKLNLINTQKGVIFPCGHFGVVCI